MSDLIERRRALSRADHSDFSIGNEAADEIERLTAALKWEQHRAERQGTHGEGCANWGPAHYECLLRERDELRQQLTDLTKKWNRVQWDAVRKLRDERDELRRQLEEAEKDARRYRYLRDQCSYEVDDYGTVSIKFRCDFEHYCDLDAAIDAAMGLTRPAEE